MHANSLWPDLIELFALNGLHISSLKNSITIEFTVLSYRKYLHIKNTISNIPRVSSKNVRTLYTKRTILLRDLKFFWMQIWK